MKVAKFKNADLTLTMILTSDEVSPGGYYETHYVQMTEWAPVEFTPLAERGVVEAQLKILDGAESELRNKFQQKLNELNTQRAELRALTHQVQS